MATPNCSAAAKRENARDCFRNPHASSTFPLFFPFSSSTRYTESLNEGKRLDADVSDSFWSRMEYTKVIIPPFHFLPDVCAFSFFFFLLTPFLCQVSKYVRFSVNLFSLFFFFQFWKYKGINMLTMNLEFVFLSFLQIVFCGSVNYANTRIV